MGGDRQSEQRHEAPTTPDTGNTEPPDCGNQADDQSNEASVSSQQHPRRRRFIGRLGKGRSTDRAEHAGASTEHAAIKPKVGLLGIVITALIGFFFGIGLNQVTDYVKRADDCADALAQFKNGLDANFTILSHTFHNFDLPDDQRAAVAQQFDNLIAFPYAKVMDKCPVHLHGNSSEYLNNDLINRWNASSREFLNCFLARECSGDDARHHVLATSDLTTKLEHEAIKVSQWGLVRRAKYEVTHLY